MSLIVGLALLGSLAAEASSFDSNGVRIHYTIAGQGRPVILLHGWMGDATMWGKSEPAEGFQVIAMDCRGHGQSGKPHDVDAYGVQMARDVVRLMDHLKIRRADLVGYSMGTFIAGAVAAWFPNRVSSVVFGGQAPLLHGAPSTGSRETEVFADAVKAGKGLGPYFIEVMPAGAKPSLEQANRFAESYFRGKDVEAYAAAGISLDRLEVSIDELRRFKGPVLFLHGSEESAGVLRKIDHAARQLPHAKRIVVKGTNHITTVARPEFGKALIEFLDAARRRELVRDRGVAW